MRNHVGLLILVLALGVIGGSISGKWTRQTEAQRTERPAPRRPDRWEYCSLSNGLVGESRAGTYWITYFRTAGPQISEYEDQATDRSGMAKAIAKLGEDGWEMVGEGQLELKGGKLTTIYFKRLRA